MRLTQWTDFSLRVLMYCAECEQINVGAVVRQTETDFTMVEFFDTQSNQCGLSRQCRLKGVLHQATESFLAVLDSITLADLIAPRTVGAKSVALGMPASRNTKV